MNIPKSYLYTTLFFLSFLVLIFNTSIINYIEELTGHLPSVGINSSTSYLYGVIWAWLLAYSISLWPINPKEKIVLLIIWGIKTFITLGVLLLYEYNYELDAFAYFSQPTEDDFTFSGISFDGTENIFNLIWLHHQLLPESYQLLKVSFSYIGLIASFIFYRAFSLILDYKNINLLLLFSLFPSILFFSSTIGKEPLLLLGISIYILGVIGLYKKLNHYYLLMIIVGLVISFSMRYWICFIFSLPLVVLFWHSKIQINLKIIILLLLLSLFYFLYDYTLHRFISYSVGGWSPYSYKSVEGKNIFEALNTLFANRSFGGSSNTWYKSFNSFSDIVEFLPLGVFTALYRPLPGEVSGIFGLLAGIENLLLLLITIHAIFCLRKSSLYNPLFQWMIAIIICWLSMYSFLSFNNFGANERYKVQIIPIILGLILYVYHEKKYGLLNTHISGKLKK